MPALSVLNNDQVSHLLNSLTLDELESFRDVVQSTLHEYSNDTKPNHQDLFAQPKTTSLFSVETGASTSIVPSCSPAGHGITLSTNYPAHLASRPTPPSTITLLSPSGRPIGLLPTRSLTAFRTALMSTCLLTRRERVQTITVFGAGELAYWHIRLALLLRGPTIRTINIINRRFSRGCQALLERMHAVPAGVRAREGWSTPAIGVLTPGFTDYERLLREQVQAADVVFLCVPSERPLFEAELLTSREARRKGRLIVAAGGAGGRTAQVREIPAEVLRQATAERERQAHHHHVSVGHKSAVEGGVVVVDSLDGAVKNAREVEDAGLEPGKLVELGELVMLDHEKTTTTRETAVPQVPEDETSDTGSSNSSSGGSRVMSGRLTAATSVSSSPEIRGGEAKMHKKHDNKDSMTKQQLLVADISAVAAAAAATTATATTTSRSPHCDSVASTASAPSTSSSSPAGSRASHLHKSLRSPARWSSITLSSSAGGSTSSSFLSRRKGGVPMLNPAAASSSSSINTADWTTPKSTSVSPRGSESRITTSPTAATPKSGKQTPTSSRPRRSSLVAGMPALSSLAPAIEAKRPSLRRNRSTVAAGSLASQSSSSRASTPPAGPHHHKSITVTLASLRGHSESVKSPRKSEGRMFNWLRVGNVVYKSVGMDMLDLVVGLRVVKMAREKGVGCHVDGW